MEQYTTTKRTESKSYFKMDKSKEVKTNKFSNKKWEPSYNAKKVSLKDIYNVMKRYLK